MRKEKSNEPVAVQGEHRDQLQAILETAVDAIITIDKAGMVESFNPAAEKIFGYSAMEIIGENVRLLMPQPDHDNHDGYINSYLETGNPKIIGIGREVVGMRKDGTPVPIELAVSEFYVGEDLKFAGISRDITARKREEAALREKSRELQESNDALDEFVYIASHDLKEPLRGIANFSAFLLEDYQDKLDEEGRHKLNTLVRLASRLDSLIEDLSYFSRVGRQELAMNEADLNEVLDKVVFTMQTAITQSGIEIRRSSRLPKVVCDATRIGEVFQNLISNAIKYNDKSAKWIEIWHTESAELHPEANAGHTEAVGNDPFQFHVRDNGIGIRDKHYDAIFKIFKRLHAREKFGGGTGVGLSIVKQIIDRHGGRVWVESTHGEGTTFNFTLGRGKAGKNVE